MPVGDGDRTVDEETFDLVYPDGARDAEALLVHPTTGRVHVVTKGVFAGEVYAAPPELADDAPNRLGLVGQVAGLVTDGAFFPDGRHVVLRTYSRATVHTFPDLEPLGSWDLPDQQQGEGIAVTPDGEVLLSSEGQGAEVLQVPVPPRIERAMAAPTETPTTAATPARHPSGGTDAQDVLTAPADRDAGRGWPGEWSDLLALGVLWRSLRPH